MALKLQLRGSTYWLRGKTVSGENVHESTGLKDKAEAEKVLIKRSGDALTVVLNGAQKNCTFDEAAGDYNVANQGHSETAFISKLVGYFGDRTLRTITQSDVDDAGRMLYSGCQPQSVNRMCHAVFSAIWTLAHRNGYCEFRHLARPKWIGGQYNGVIRKKAKRRVGSFPVEYDHAAPFVLAISPAPAMVMTTLFYTGMRPSELFKLNAKDVNIAKRWIRLDQDTKSGKERGVPIHEMLVPMLTALVKRGGVLFRTPRGQPYPVFDPEDEKRGKVSSQMKSALHGATRRTGIADISAYTARHTVSSQLVAHGVHEYVKDQILGHSFEGDPSHTYTDVPRPKLIEAINMLPVIETWANAPWMKDPLAYANKLIEGTGRRTDLEQLRERREKRAKVNARKKETERKRGYRANKKPVLEAAE